MEEVTKHSQDHFNNDQDNDRPFEPGRVLVVKLIAQDFKELVHDVQSLVENFYSLCYV
jgi:hypothetical protein